jgi:hypothetical protein
MLVCGRDRRSPLIGTAVFFLDFLFMSLHLLFNFLHGRVNGRKQFIGCGLGDEVVLAGNRNHNFDFGGLFVFQIDDDLDRHQPIKEPIDFAHLFSELILRGFTQMTMAYG